MKRRAFLGAATAAAAVSSFPTPSIARRARQLKLVSSFPLRGRSELPSRAITEGTGGHFDVKIFGPGELVGGFCEVFFVDVADGYDVLASYAVHISSAAAADSDVGDVELFIRGIACPEDSRFYNGESCPEGCALFEKCATIH